MLFAKIARALRRPRAKPAPRPVVLMYHRIASIGADPWGLAVDPACFEHQIASIAAHRTALSMDELVQRLAAHTLPADAVAVTFDDGYRDNLINAAPVLARYGVPATFFIATGFVGRASPFWWDELTAMILESPGPARHVVDCCGEEVVLGWGRPERDDGSSWRASDGAHTERQRCYFAVWSKLKSMTPAERDRAMEALRGCVAGRCDPLAMPMSAREVRQLLSNGLCEIGAHSVEHPSLTRLSSTEVRREISESAAACRVLSGQAVNGFAYPYGDMNASCREEVRRAGFGWACSTEGRFLETGSIDAYAVPRIAASNRLEFEL